METDTDGDFTGRALTRTTVGEAVGEARLERWDEQTSQVVLELGSASSCPESRQRVRAFVSLCGSVMSCEKS